MLSNSIIESRPVPSVELPAAKLELVKVAGSEAANAGNMLRDSAMQRRLRRQRRQARAMRSSRGWTVGLW
jgi:hypothetical protein